MKLPEKVSLYIGSKKYGPGDEVPDELIAGFPDLPLAKDDGKKDGKKGKKEDKNLSGPVTGTN